MRKFLLVLVVVMFGFVAVANAGTATTTTTTPTAKETTKVTTTSTTKGAETDTATTTKLTVTPKAGDIKKETVTFKKYNENNPTSDLDNTVIIVQGTAEVERPISNNWKQNHLEKFTSKPVTITSTYDPKLSKYIITNVEEEMLKK